MILSVSRRTDIPAFYSEWFFGRISEGYVCVRNPMNARQISKINISKNVVDCIVFWTKNPAPMLPRLDRLAGYDYYFQFTLNDYETDAEPRVPELSRRVETFTALSEKIGKERVIWRYDPIFFSEKYTPERHINSFAKIAAALKNHTEKCVFSFVDVYPSKNAGSLNRLGFRKLLPAELDEFAGELAKIAKQNGLDIATCAEAIDLTKHGILHNSCIDKALIERITGAELRVGSDNQRENCGCVKCDDIGSYDTCPHGCVYCYANFRPKAVFDKQKAYDKNSPLLCDKLGEGDKITERPVKSFKTDKSGKTQSGGEESGEQLTFFDLGS